jgi:molecular chaperone DnaJ
MTKDFYKILNVDKGATQDEIKKSFRKIAHKYHPDKSGGDEKKFKEASEAYATLGDENKRKQYDMMGGGGFPGGGAGPGPGGFDFSNFGGFGGQGGSQHFEFDLGDIFGNMGGFSGRQERKGRDIQMDLNVTLSEAMLGVEKEIKIQKPSECNKCKGTGAKDGKTKECKKCNGAGSIKKEQRTPFGTFAMNAHCNECQGLGHVVEETCGTCSGAGVYKQEYKTNISIPAGIQDGQAILIRGAGESVRSGISGDLVVRVYVDIPKKFSKEQEEAIEGLRKVGL